MITTLPHARQSSFRRADNASAGRREGLAQFSSALRAHMVPCVLEMLTILDVGAGDGWLREFLDAKYYVALDFDQVYGRSLSLVGDAHMLPFRDDIFDLVVSKQTLPHFANPVLASKEMLRVARKCLVIRQEFPGGGPIGWDGHSKVQIESPDDILRAFDLPGVTAQFDGVDFVVRKTGGREA